MTICCMLTVLVGHAITSFSLTVLETRRPRSGCRWTRFWKGSSGLQTASSSLYPHSAGQLAGRLQWHTSIHQLHPYDLPKAPHPKTTTLGIRLQYMNLLGGAGWGLVNIQSTLVTKTLLGLTWIQLDFLPFFLQEEPSFFFFFSDQCRDKNPEVPEHPLFDTFLV